MSELQCLLLELERRAGEQTPSSAPIRAATESRAHQELSHRLLTAVDSARVVAVDSPLLPPC